MDHEPRWRVWLRDVWRGYSDADFASVMYRTSLKTPDGPIAVGRREIRAWHHYCRSKKVPDAYWHGDNRDFP